MLCPHQLVPVASDWFSTAIVGMLKPPLTRSVRADTCGSAGGLAVRDGAFQDKNCN